MKSALEIALEKMEENSGPARRLSSEEKAVIADINTRCDADIAAARLDYDQRISQVDTPEQLQILREELAGIISKIEEKRTSECDRVWNAEQA